jgi:class 3 adenylate cyclase
VKLIGDSAHFVAGLPFEASNLSETDVAARVLRAINELLDSIIRINVELEQRNCPKVRVKVSCSYGHCGFGFDGTAEKFRFDLGGDTVNIAKRFEENMTKDFYSKYGENVALVSEQVVRMAASKATEVLPRFKERVYSQGQTRKTVPSPGRQAVSGSQSR